jgi:peptide/nickel transport system substrate-binding protein
MADHSRSRPMPRPAAASRRDVVLATTLGLGLAGLAPVRPRPALAQAAASPRRGGTLRVASSPPADALDPPEMRTAGSVAIVQQVAEYLVWAEPDQSLRPVLATRWETADGGRTWEFDIRQGVRFHDGRDLAADDVVATFRRLVDPAAAPSAAAQLGFLRAEGVSKVGEHRVRFALERPVGQFPRHTHIHEAVILPRDHAGGFAQNPVGTGPFRLTGFRPREGASLARNDAYWDQGRPYLDGVEFALLESPRAEVLALLGGRADVALHVSPADAAPLLAGSPDVRVVEVPAAEHRQLAMRCDQAPFDDARVRRAVALAVRRQELVRDLLGGRADLGNDHVVAPIYPERVALPQRPADVERARALLAEAGHGGGLTVDLHAPEHLELAQYARLVQGMLAPVGIAVNLRIEPPAAYYDHWTEVAFGVTDWAGRPTAVQMLSTAFRGGSAWNQARWRNDRFDALLDRIEAEPDPAERADLTARAAAIMHEEVPAVIAYFSHNLRPVRRNVAGVPGNASRFLDLTQAHLS